MAVVLPTAGNGVEAMSRRIPEGLTYPSWSGNVDAGAGNGDGTRGAQKTSAMTCENSVEIRVDLPDGFTHAEAEDVLRKWLQYIPTAANPGGWQPKA